VIEGTDACQHQDSGDRGVARPDRDMRGTGYRAAHPDEVSQRGRPGDGPFPARTTVSGEGLPSPADRIARTGRTAGRPPRVAGRMASSTHTLRNVDLSTR
jgi:hypothetical protein